MSLREELNELLTSERLRVNGGAIIRGAVTEVVDKYEAELVARIEAFPWFTVFYERENIKVVRFDDVLALFNLNSEHKPEAREARPAREAMLETLQSVRDAKMLEQWTPLVEHLLAQIIDALGERPGK